MIAETMMAKIMAKIIMEETLVISLMMEKTLADKFMITGGVFGHKNGILGVDLGGGGDRIVVGNTIYKSLCSSSLLMTFSLGFRAIYDCLH